MRKPAVTMKAYHGTSSVFAEQIEVGWCDVIHITIDVITAAKEAMWTCIGDHAELEGHVSKFKTGIGGVPDIYELWVDLMKCDRDPDYHSRKLYNELTHHQQVMNCVSLGLYAWICPATAIITTRRFSNQEIANALEKLKNAE